MKQVPTYDDVVAAADRLRGHAVRTPLLSCAELDRRTGGRIFLKAENLQRTGSFKFRGAMNAISALMASGADPAPPARGGVIAFSSGNHAQGVAEAARLHGIPATIIMPDDAPLSKIHRTERAGAAVILYNRNRDSRDEITRSLTERLAAELIHPFDNQNVIAGQGTLALEAVDTLAELGIAPDLVLACAGGGGLAAGVSLVMAKRCPQARFHTVEPEGFDDYRRSLLAGERLSNPTTSGSVCDAILTPMPGARSFEILHGYASEGLAVTDADAMNAVAFAYHELKIVLEPGGAVALAAVLSGKIDVRDKTVLLTLSGGNVDPAIFQRALEGSA